ncbi:hypothetical protein C8R44DRAFT_757511 [Mycena epipterygia]|nr:hypothetical protein C8R44DRAFT_757511 [Mycena epipterygia]
MHHTPLTSWWWIVLGIFSFSLLDGSSSTAIVRRSALTGFGTPVSTTPLVVLTGQPEVSALPNGHTTISTAPADVIVTGRALTATESAKTLLAARFESVELPAYPNFFHYAVIVSACAGTIYTLGISLSIWLVRQQKSPLRTKIPSVESPERIDAQSDSHSYINRASWTPYIETTGHTLSPSSTISTRQLYISNQVNRAREKLAKLEEMSTLLRSVSSTSSSTARLTSWTYSNHDATAPAEVEPVDNPEDPHLREVQNRLECAIREIEALNGRIHELERQRRSSWALGLSDEHPPEYVQ